jgi:hypothetical protein
VYSSGQVVCCGPDVPGRVPRNHGRGNLPFFSSGLSMLDSMSSHEAKLTYLKYLFTVVEGFQFFIAPGEALFL